jgi:hypothetical protein
MTQPDIKLSTEEVRRHSRMVDEAAAMLQEATSGAHYVDMHDEVYGVLCSPLILPILNPLQDMAHGEVRTATDATSHIAGQLRTMADNVDITDSEAASRINGVPR